MARRWYSKNRRFARVWTYCACGHVVLTILFALTAEFLDTLGVAEQLAWALGAVAMLLFSEVGVPRNFPGSLVGIVGYVLLNGAVYGLIEAWSVQLLRRVLPSLPSTDPWCSKCGYDLRGREQGSEPRCPECGEPCFFADTSEATRA